MIQFLHHIGLGKQAVYHNLVILSITLFSNFLDCPLLVQTFVHGEIYNRHAAPPYFFQDLIFPVNYRSYLCHIPYLTLPLSVLLIYYPALLCASPDQSDIGHYCALHPD